MCSCVRVLIGTGAAVHTSVVVSRPTSGVGGPRSGVVLLAVQLAPPLPRHYCAVAVEAFAAGCLRGLQLVHLHAPGGCTPQASVATLAAHAAAVAVEL